MAKPIVFVIRDGWGINPGGKAEREKNGDATLLAQTPFHDHLYREYPSATLTASGEDVGLPEGQMGNTEVGHLNLGRAASSIRTYADQQGHRGGRARVEPRLTRGLCESQNGRLHLIGLVSDGGVHTH